MRKSFDQYGQCHSFVNTMKLKPMGMEFLGLVVVDTKFLLRMILLVCFRFPVLVVLATHFAHHLRELAGDIEDDDD